MTDHKMPLILDGSMGGMGEATMNVDQLDVDDLFGDGVPLGLPPRPVSRRLRQRLDELRSRGCCRGLAWSKNGTIASIAPDGQALHVRHLRANPKDASWGMSEPKAIAPWQNLIGGPLVHLSWSPANAELAVIDSVGRVFILNFNGDLNRPLVSRRWDSDAVDDLHSVVGTYWLNPLPTNNSRFTPVYGPAVKNGNGTEYVFETSGIPTMGPSHPNHKMSAFICITTNGLLKMFWMQSSGKYEESTLELESVTSADDLITHAAVCSDKTKTIYIAMATASQQLRIVQVAINFSAVKPDNPQNSPQVAASLNKRHVTVTSWFQPGTSGSHLEPSMTKISHIELLPSSLDIATKDWSPIVVLTVRSYVPEPNSPYQEVQSIIDRWELLPDQKQTLAPAFQQLGSRRNSAGSSPPTVSRLRKLDSTIVRKIVVGIHTLLAGKVICFMYNDGSVEHRDRHTMNEVYRDTNLDRIHCILEAGFTLSGAPSCLQIAFSPSNFSLAQMYEDGQVKWHNLEYTLQDPASISDAHLAAVNAGFAIATTNAAPSAINFDDILAVARKFTHYEEFAVKWVTDIVQILRITIDYAEEIPHDHLIRNNSLQLCFSILNHLGWKGEYRPRHYRSKLTMLALSLRHIVILVSLASNAPNAVRGTASPLDEPEVVNCLAGCVKWSVDLLAWLCDSLFCLLDDKKFMAFLTQSNQTQQLFYMTQYLQNENNIALHLVLCSSTRNLICAVCRRILLLDNYSSRAVHWYTSRSGITDSANNARGATHTALFAAYRKVQQYTSSALVKADDFDKLLNVLATDIRNAYSTSLPPLAAEKAAKNPPTPNQNPNASKPDRVKEARQYCELDLLLVKAPPPSFLAVIAKFFRTDLVQFRSHTNVAKLFFSNYDLLDIVDKPRALEKRRAKGMRVDMFRRVEISRTPGVAWKRCARCANVMEDQQAPPNKPGYVFLLGQQRVCCCSGRLALVA
ncbi:RNA polymerase II mediator complex subunit Sin4 [Xylariomycetidae sp. FL0641]|nr:RNA polymerase II mediator complex subunit Sin4 [Xylariomycetidae sp. FL0641]